MDKKVTFNFSYEFKNRINSLTIFQTIRDSLGRIPSVIDVVLLNEINLPFKLTNRGNPEIIKLDWSGNKLVNAGLLGNTTVNSQIIKKTQDLDVKLSIPLYMSGQFIQWDKKNTHLYNNKDIKHLIQNIKSSWDKKIEVLTKKEKRNGTLVSIMFRNITANTIKKESELEKNINPFNYQLVLSIKYPKADQLTWKIFDYGIGRLQSEIYLNNKKTLKDFNHYDNTIKL